MGKGGGTVSLHASDRWGRGKRAGPTIRGGRRRADSGPVAAGAWVASFDKEQGSGRGREADRWGRAAQCRSHVSQTVFKPFQNSLNRFKQTSNHSNFNQSKKDLSLLKNFQIKYCFEKIEEWSNFLHMIFFRF
jgi:hypothetical protein